MNHIATNLITKGFINSFPLTNGILLLFKYSIVTPTKTHHGSGDYATLHQDIKNIGIDNINYINVYVDWYKKSFKENIKIEANLIMRNIKAELLKDFKKEIKIKVNLIKKTT